MLSDIQIARNATLRPISSIAEACGIPQSALYSYGQYMAKVNPDRLTAKKKRGHMILVTAINPTPAGEGKTTVSIGLGEGIANLGKSAMLALREPSMGPVFGMKGGAAGGGYAQVLPMEEINLHFTGDFHAIAEANNLLAALIDNHIHKGNALGLHRVTWRRCLDVNDRQLRYIVDGLHGNANGVPREDGFDITPASEIMAAFCLAENVDDLRRRLGNLLLGYTRDGAPVTVNDLGATGALLVLLKQAIQPNLVQTIGGLPALVHGGPFANIAHGCNSIIATKTALSLADYVVTEAGFGADLGAEKFLDIKCRKSELWPSAAVVVATIRALKYGGGVAKDDLSKENLAALHKGCDNLLHHVRTLQKVYGLPCVVAINRFASDTPEEESALITAMKDAGILAVPANPWAEGGKGCISLAEAVMNACGQSTGQSPEYAYPLDLPYKEKIKLIAQRIYGAKAVEFTAAAERDLKNYDEKFPGLPVCVAKTQYSLSDNPKLTGLPKDFVLHVRSVRINTGAEFVIALCGDIITMPGLPAHPAALDIDIDQNGDIVGLF